MIYNFVERRSFIALLGLFSAMCISVATDSKACQAKEDSKRPLEHTDYELWNTVGGQQLSGDGKWVMFTVRNEKAGNTLKIRQTTSTKEYSIKHGAGGRFTDDSSFAIYNIEPDPELLKKLSKAKKKDLPKRKLEILDLESGSHSLVERVARFSIPKENSDWVGILLIKPVETETVTEQKSPISETLEVTEEGLQRPQSPWKWAAETEQAEEAAGSSSQEKKPTEQKKGSGKENSEEKAEAKPDDEDKDKAKEKEKDNGTVLVLHNLKTQVQRRFPNVTEFVFSEKGEVLLMATSGNESDDDGVTLFDLEKSTGKQIASGTGNYTSLATNPDGSHVAFLTDRDDYDAEKSSWSLYHSTKNKKLAKQVAHEGEQGIPEGWWVSSSSGPYFSEDSRRLFFSTKPKPQDAYEENKKDKEEEEEDPKAVLDIWHWQDPLLQPQQLLQAAQERKRSYLAVYDLRAKKILQIANTDMPNVSIDRRSTANFATANSNFRYQKELSWDVPGFQDTYLVNLKNGESELVNERVKYFARLSPNGKYAFWFDSEQQHWFGMSVKDRKVKNLSSAIPHPLYNELHDTPSLPRSYGSAGWLDDDKGLLVYDRYDIWKLDPEGREAAVCLTSNFGRENNVRLRYIRLDFEQRTINPQEPWLLSALDETSKASGYFKLQVNDGAATPDRLIMLDERIGGLRKARYTDDIVLTRQTFRRYPDLWHSTLELKKVNRLSLANPQQHNYSWGTVEKVSWKSDAGENAGEELDGLLYKPDDFDAEKQYPLMVYFYERNSDNLHQYHTPAAGRSIINFSFYVSRGYVLFIPDIPYRTGEPGPSAADAVLPGIQSVVDLGFIDEKRIGVQGHSWGGYQIAYLVTQTNVFACAESGAPVSNMTSAYGGIRWGSGMSRMFQYERTQSRIGETLWDAREKYIANSPVFFADKIETPLLILHNDKDTAVPWYQGIELFVAMRRLSKPAWMLNYNGDPHWVMSEANRMDFATRMQQFFDHYLKDAPTPVWMAEGIPAVDKGEKFGFEYVREPGEQEVAESEEANEESTDRGDNVRRVRIKRQR